MSGKLIRPLAIGVVILAMAGAVALWWADRELNRPLAIPPDGLLLAVPPGGSLRSVANDLAAQDALLSPEIITLYGRLNGAAERIKAGEYEVPAGTSSRSLLALLESGAVKLHTITLIEGWRLADALATLRAHPAIKSTEVSVSAKAAADWLGIAGGNAEGWLFPDTYRFPRGTADVDILRTAHERMRRELDAAWQARATGLPLATPVDALTLASIVEKETALESERARIAGVFVRRLRMGMRLQTDPTVIYGLGNRFDGDLRRSDLQADTPYNTYTRVGLPPTPIALPGAASLRAAVQPEETGALFFVASGRGDGSHVFSATLAEHNAAVRSLIQRSRGASP